MITLLNDTFTITNLNYFFCRYQHLRDEFSKVTFFNFGINVLLHLAFLSTPVTASADVSAFFKTYLPSSSSSHPEPEFNFSEIDDRDIECFVINSMEEFEAVAPPSVELPVIDFDKYTLIIGQHWMGHPGYSFEKQVVDTESDKMTLNLVYKQLKGGTPAIMTIFYFWGLYDKLPEKTLTVNKIII